MSKPQIYITHDLKRILGREFDFKKKYTLNPISQWMNILWWLPCVSPWNRPPPFDIIKTKKWTFVILLKSLLQGIPQIQSL